jgi:hypothetical protein
VLHWTPHVCQRNNRTRAPPLHALALLAVAGCSLLHALFGLGYPSAPKDAASAGVAGHERTPRGTALHGRPGRPTAVYPQPAQWPLQAPHRRGHPDVCKQPRTTEPRRCSSALVDGPRFTGCDEAEAHWKDMRKVRGRADWPVRESAGRHVPFGMLHLSRKFATKISRHSALA